MPALVSSLPVAIIGGGLAGLVVARRLHATGTAFVLLEARDRLGGRILTVDDTGQPAEDGVELGPSWFWPHVQPAIAALIAELGLPAFPQASGDVLVERMLREGPQRFAVVEQEPQSYRVGGGTAAVVRTIAQALPSTSLHLGARVTSMSLDEEGIVLSIASVAGERRLRADRVIAALPPRLLEASVRFTPPVDDATAKRWRATPTWMAPHAKFVARYNRAFWRAAGLSGTAQSMIGPMPEIHDASSSHGEAALFGFVGLGVNDRRAMGEATLTRACVAQLARLFGPEAGAPRATLLMDWAADALTATAADQVPSGHPVVHATPWVTGAWAERLVLAGSETSPVDPGYLAGAVVAAERATARS